MPYLLLVFGLLLGLYGLYRFFLQATPQQMGAFVLTAGFITLILLMAAMALTGRLPAALGLLAALIPFAMAYKKHKAERARLATENPTQPETQKTTMDRAEAFEILGLHESATAENIEDAYKRLMKKIHPDMEGSEWMARKLNEARDMLLKNSKPE